MFSSIGLALLKFGVGFTGPCKRRRQYAGSCCKSRGSGFFFVVVLFFFSFPKLLTGIVYILQYYYSCYELPKAATSKYCRVRVVPAQIIATNAGLPNLGLISLFK